MKLKITVILVILSMSLGFVLFKAPNPVMAGNGGLFEQFNLFCTTNPVVTNFFDDGPGSLRRAVAEACAGSTITFNLTGTIHLKRQITIDKNLTIQGPGANLLSVRNNAPTYTPTPDDLYDMIELIRKVTATYTATNRIFYVNAGVTAAINGLTVKDAKVIGDGAGIYNNGTLTITGVTISNNRMIGDGGGIFNNNILTVTNSTISNNGWTLGVSNNSSKGGGIYNNGTLTVTGSTISGNDSAPCSTAGLPCSSNYIPGGGIFNNGMLSVTGSTFSGNRAFIYGQPGGGGITNYLNGTLNVSDTIFDGNEGVAGGIFNYQGQTANVTNSIFKNNWGLNFGLNGSRDGGGGIGSRGTTTVTNSTFSNNLCQSQVLLNGGGGISVAFGTFTLTNSTVSNNQSTGTNLTNGGGGIFVGDGTLNITNSTVTNNKAGHPASGTTQASLARGGGIYRSGIGTVNVRNSIIAGNTTIIPGQFGPDYYGTLNSQGYNIIGDNQSTTITGDTTGNIVGTSAAPVDARLAPLGFYGGKTITHALLSNSPAINAGDTANAPPADQRGAARESARRTSARSS